MLLLMSKTQLLSPRGHDLFKLLVLVLVACKMCSAFSNSVLGTSRATTLASTLQTHKFAITVPKNGVTAFSFLSSSSSETEFSLPAEGMQHRRAFLAGSTATILGSISALFARPSLAIAGSIPMVTTDEFLKILNESVRSIARVEFSGAMNDVVTVRLIDDTAFGIKDVLESPTDARSPLKIAAICRENGVPTKFVTLEAVLSKTSKRKKIYTNERVQLAAAKEKEKKLRMEQDERDVQAELSRMKQASAAAAAAAKAED